jgi:hypothetical protein
VAAGEASCVAKQNEPTHNTVKHDLKYELTKTKQKRDRWRSAKITPVLPIAGQKLPPQFAEYSTFFAVFQHFYLFIHSTISREVRNDVLRRQCIPFVALIPTYRTIRYHNPRPHNPSRSFGLDSRPVHGVFVFDKVAMGQIYLRVLRFPPAPYHSTTAPYSYLNHLPPKLTSTI